MKNLSNELETVKSLNNKGKSRTPKAWSEYTPFIFGG